MPPMTGRVVAGRYSLQQPIGRGAMGVVWRARDQLLDREVAVKEVVISALIGEDERRHAYQRTLREARTAGRLSHRGVVAVYDVAEEDGRPWIIMELVPSRSLDQVLTVEGRLAPVRAGHIGQQLLAALAHAHACGVLHRDVKPSNVLIARERVGGPGPYDWNERAVLTDFGIAQFEGDPRLTQTGMVMGSPGFTAPERIRGGGATPASDLWSLGATIYTAVEGRGPYEQRGGAITTMSAIIHEDAPIAPHAGRLGPLIAALLRRNPAERPSAVAAARMFAQVLPLLENVPAAPAVSHPATMVSPAVPPLAADDDAAADKPAGTATDNPDMDQPVAGLAADEPVAETGEPKVAVSAREQAPAAVRAEGTARACDGTDSGDGKDPADDAEAEAGEPAEGGEAGETRQNGEPTVDAMVSAAPRESADAEGPADTAEPAPTAEPADAVDTVDTVDTGDAVDAAEPAVAAEAGEAAGDADTGEAPDTGESGGAAESVLMAEAVLSAAPGIKAGAGAHAPAAAPTATVAQAIAPSGAARSAKDAAKTKIEPTAAGYRPTGISAPGPAHPTFTASRPGERVTPTFSAARTDHLAAERPQQRTQAPRFGAVGAQQPPGQAAGTTFANPGAQYAGPTHHYPDLAVQYPPGTGGGRLQRRGGPGRWVIVTIVVMLIAMAISIGVAYALRHHSSGAVTDPRTPYGSVNALNDPTTAIPAGWTTITVAPAEAGTTAGFSVGLPPGWTSQRHGLATRFLGPDGLYLDVDMTPHTYPNMVTEGRYIEQQSLATGRFQGYRRLHLQAVPVRGTQGAIWQFTWMPTGSARLIADDILFIKPTSAGSQSYAVYIKGAIAGWSGTELPVFERILRTFQTVSAS